MKQCLIMWLCISSVWSLTLTKSYNCILGLAAARGDVSKVRSALKHKANIDYQNRALWNQTALMNACAESKRRTVAYLVRKNADVNLLDEDRKTALMYAALADNHEKGATIATVLIDAHADLNAVDSHRKTALIHALKAQNLHVAHVLLLAGADRTLKDSAEKTALDYFKVIPAEGDHEHAELYKKVSELLAN